MKALTLFAVAALSSAHVTAAQSGIGTRESEIGRRERLSTSISVNVADLSSLASLASLGSLASLESMQGLASLGGLSATSGLSGLAGLAVLADGPLSLGATTRGSLRMPSPGPWIQGDPADSLYRAATEALNDGDYRRAASLFRRVTDRYPRSEYAGRALYFQAFALYRSGNGDDLQDAARVLASLSSRYPNVSTSEARSLRTRVCGELARRGDSQCAQEIVERADPDASDRSDRNDRSDRSDRTARAGTRTARAGECPSDDDDDRVAALNALLQMNSEQALPILKRVLERREPCSVELRRKAVFLVSQKRSEESIDILLNAAKTDPDKEVREQAVFWLGQTGSDRAVDVLQDLLKSSNDEAVKDKAIFSLSQHRSPRSGQILRDFALRDGESEHLREQAIFWLGQRRSEENADFLKGLFSKLRDESLKKKIIFSLAQQRGNQRWLMDLAVEKGQDIEMRKEALFWAGQNGASIEELVGLYDRMSEHEMRDKLIFVYSQRRERAAVDKLMDIAKNEKNRDLRKQAIFWLGQSRDPRAPEFLLQLIDKRPEGER
jgi:HEAT repeat protein